MNNKGERVKRLIVVAFGLASLAWASAGDLEPARKLYNLTEFQKSLQLLQALPQKTAAVYDLMGRNYFGQGEFKKASESLEKAVALEPANAMYHLWLGRAYGRRAETSSMLTAPGLATKARQSFEKATKLDPSNLEAQSDLFEYYLEAPGFLGGGYDKAANLAEQISRLNPVEGYWAQAKLAEKRKEFPKAEAQLRRAVELAPQQIGRLIDLAHLFTKQGRYHDADLSLAKAAQIDPNSARLMFAKADLYIKSKRNLEEAKELLKRYLGSALTPDDPPRAEAEKLLKQVLGS
ncbi:MAG: tetratricopeptide repeat protein [Candidatus Solibacter sp.]